MQKQKLGWLGAGGLAKDQASRQAAVTDEAGRAHDLDELGCIA